LEKNASTKRKAQGLIKKGAFTEAAALYKGLVETGDMQPYDYVVLGDLLIRSGERREALDRYEEALNSYAEAGLHRNAIALAKKLHRLAPKLDYVHRRLGDLYGAEGLASEACLHYVTYLEQVDREEEGTRDAVEDVCVRLLNLSLPSFDLVERIVAFAKTAECGTACAPGVMAQSRRASSAGEEEQAAKLSALAQSLDENLDPDAVPSPGQEAAGTMPEGGNFLDPGAVYLNQDAPATTVPMQEEPAAAEPPTLSLEGFSYEEDPSAVNLSDATDDRDDDAESEAVPELEVMDSEPVVEPAPMKGSGNGSSPSADEVEADEDPDELRARALEFLERGEPIRAQRELVRAARACLKAARSADAQELYRRVVHMDPNHLEALRGLVEIAHINGERGKMAHWGCELGDVLLAREMYAEAKVQFERVLAFDPENIKAQSRVNRLRTMSAVEEASFGTLAPDASEVEGAKVTVMDQSKGTQSDFDLGEILREFQTAVVDQISDGDSRSHHDLGMTYREMGLMEEAAREFETAATGEEDQAHSLEMLGECYLHLDRFEEAHDLFQRLLPDLEGDGKARLHLQMGRTYEGMGAWDKAEESYFAALELNEDLVEALELLEGLDQRRERGAA
jgi:tetratricopeptide (TPR) repeat protein